MRPPPHRSRRAGLTRLEAVVLFVVLAGGWCLFTPVLVHTHPKANRTRCSNNLRQLGLAAIQYSDDKRFFPHVRGTRELDGGLDSSDTPRKVRALLWYGYHDNPEGFVCPDSTDLVEARGLREMMASPQGLRAWRWGGRVGDPAAPSPIRAEDGDPTLLATTELSFGWTRRHYNPNVRSTALLAADRASVGDPAGQQGLEGNHPDGSNVLQADGTIMWLSAEAEGAATLADVGDGAATPSLTVVPPRPSDGHRRGFRDLGGDARAAWAVLPPAALLVLLVVAVATSRAPVAGGAAGVAGAGATAPGAASARLPRGGVARVRPSRVETLPPGERATLGAGGPTGTVVLQATQRCPVCHDGLGGGEGGGAEPLTRCLACRAVFHAECVAQGGACPTLGCPG